MKTWNSVAIVGVGLIGGSVGLAIRKRNPAAKVIGTGSSSRTLETAERLGAVTAVVDKPQAAVAEADLVLVCTPVGLIVEQVRELAPHCRSGALITDVGSTKLDIVTQLELFASEPAWPRDVRFVGSHPIAGNEKRGPQHANADLFVDRTTVITPTDSTRPDDCESLRAFWASLGAKVVLMPAAEHDRALAVTSHLPHLVAAAIAGVTPEEYLTLTAGGWQDTTRIAAGDPLLWRQILLSNRANVLAAVDRFEQLLANWRTALESQDATELERLLTEAKRIRDAVGN